MEAMAEGHPVAVVTVEVTVAKLEDISLYCIGDKYASFKGAWSSTEIMIKG